MARAAARAAEDAADSEVLSEADLLGTVDAIAWAYDDLPAELAARVGAKPEQTISALPGGSSPCQLLNEVANRIADGQARLAVLAGAETMHTRRRARQEGVSLEHWSGRPPRLADYTKGQRPLTSDLERWHGIVLPIQCYPLYECALRARAGRTIEEHQRAVSEMMARFAEVAARNPFAWFPVPWTPEEIRTVSDGNRWVCFPYPKRMNAITHVDMAAALVVMSTSEADRWGIPPERRVHYLGGACAVDAWWPTERPDFSSSPAYRRASHAALGEAGVTLEELDRESQPQRSIVVVRLDDGRRTVANGEDTPLVFARLLEQEGVGARGRVIPGQGSAPNRFVLVE
jgi:acetyl-CoA C-acetyltransferase